MLRDDHDYEEWINDSGTSTNVWVCKECGAIKQTGPASIERRRAVNPKDLTVVLEFWNKDPVVCRNILAALKSEEGKSENELFNAVWKDDVRSLYTLRAYVEYLVELGCVADRPIGNTGSVQARHEYFITPQGTLALDQVNQSVERATEVFPRSPEHDRRKK